VKLYYFDEAPVEGDHLQQGARDPTPATERTAHVLKKVHNRRYYVHFGLNRSRLQLKIDQLCIKRFALGDGRVPAGELRHDGDSDGNGAGDLARSGPAFYELRSGDPIGPIATLRAFHGPRFHLLYSSST